MPKQPLPKLPCPRCGTAKHVKLVGTAGELAHCGKCDGHFDAVDPDEGGDYDDRRPDARLIREENQRRGQRHKR